ncbi:DNA polymerase beta superfamily protein [Streptomyces sp. V2I9]|uniref:nucleotidyltransferase domain-containing protein n=1 Tax=Streptomyces sp. V2I9 TaxID=3042304 RepID=UPI00278621AB|nr:nucleotidyltransferase domain-containing protein [Streptomyces sp. V2I9]MDQ0983683.1 putative nucleotidyltransferase [Streptomyces sp. V2I9]
MITATEARLARAGLPVTDLRPDLAHTPGHLAFATVSGAHLYGFPSRDSDVDLRGVHVLPAEDLVGLREPEETRTRMWERDGVELDLVTHDLRKFVRLMLRPNGYVLEQLLSPLVVHTSPLHTQLTALAPGVLTRNHAHHYRGFAGTQWRLYGNTGELKPLLYTFRALLTGIHLMRSGEVSAHLPTLLTEIDAPAYLPDLIAAKAEAEHSAATGLDGEAVARDVTELHRVLDEARADSRLPDAVTAREDLHDLVVRARLTS